MDRFDFEQQLLKCWCITDNIETVLEGTLDHSWDKDKISNALLGIKEIYNLEFDKLFKQFEQLVHDGKLK